MDKNTREAWINMISQAIAVTEAVAAMLDKDDPGSGYSEACSSNRELKWLRAMLERKQGRNEKGE